MGNGYPTASQLISNMGTTAAHGSTYPNEVSGLATYLGPGGQNTAKAQIVGEQISTVNGPWGTVNNFGIQNNTVPTAMAMYNWLLAANDAVEFLDQLVRGWRTPPLRSMASASTPGRHQRYPGHPDRTGRARDGRQ